VEERPRSWYGLRKNNEEPLLTRAHKILIFILALGGVFGMGWNVISKAQGAADARYAKAIELRANAIEHEEIREDVAAISEALQTQSRALEYQFLEKIVSDKRSQIREIDKELNDPRVSEREKTTLRSLKGQIEIEINRIIKKQELLIK
jgi:hypothetical protein